MTFLKALQHAFIGYGIRRNPWKEGAILCWYEDRLRWTNEDTDPIAAYEISLSDVYATDWETI